MKAKAKKPAKPGKLVPKRTVKAVPPAKPLSVGPSKTPALKSKTKIKNSGQAKPAARSLPAKAKVKVSPVARLALRAKSPVRRAGTNSPAQSTSAPAPSPDAIPDLPDILFEGDRPGAPGAGPDKRYVLGTTAPTEHFAGEGELPEAYGTRQVLVTARDPHWLYVHWDLTREQLREYNAQSMHKHLVLRVARNGGQPEPLSEVHVHPESRHWFVHVADAGVKYVIELGYYGKAAGWTSISTSAPTLAPPDAASTDTTARFATIPMQVALTRLVEIVKTEVEKTGTGENQPLAHTLEQLRHAGHPELPPVGDTAATARPWTSEQERALAEVISMRQFGRVNVGSLDITELVQRGLQADFSSIMAALAGPGGISSLGAISSLGGVSSPEGGAPAGPREFWLNVNAELIIYGATQAGATLTIGGQPVKLRPDGSFSFRFALPDGQYELPITAVSGDNTEARHVEFKFSRATEYIGDVGQHPQDPSLKPPIPGNPS